MKHSNTHIVTTSLVGLTFLLGGVFIVYSQSATKYAPHAQLALSTESTEGYCYIPYNVSGSCTNKMSVTTCLALGGIFSASNSTGACATPPVFDSDNPVGYCYRPHNLSESCKTPSTRLFCESLLGEFSYSRDSGACANAPVYDPDGYCHLPHNLASNCSLKMKMSACEAAGGTYSEWKNTDACANAPVYDPEGYCYIPHNVSGSCKDKMKLSSCKSLGGIHSEWKNTGACANPPNFNDEDRVGYCYMPHTNLPESCKVPSARSFCELRGGTFSETKSSGACANAPVYDPDGYCHLPHNLASNCSLKMKMSACEAAGGTYSEWKNTGACGTTSGVASSKPPFWGSDPESFDFSSTPATSQPVPSAGYEDEVLVNIEEYNNPFPDTNPLSLTGKAAAELYRRSVIGGFPDGEFKGGRPVNRAEAAKFLLLARGQLIPDGHNNARFWDVVEEQWYTKYVVKAAEEGIISGYSDGSFRPAQQVNTAEFLKMITLAFNVQSSGEAGSYADVSPTAWYAEYAGVAKSYNLFPDRTTYLHPERPLTRDDVAVAIYQYLINR